MDISEIYKQRIIHLCNIRSSTPNIELECLFNKSESIHFTEFTKLLTHIKSIANAEPEQKYVPNTWNVIGQEDTLDITVHKNNNVHRRSDLNIRTTIHSKENISKYCQTNSLDGVRVTRVYKNSNIKQDISNNKMLQQKINTLHSDALLVGDRVTLRTDSEGIIKGTISNIDIENKIYSVKDRRNNIYTTSNYKDIRLQYYGMYMEDFDVQVNIKTEVSLDNLESKTNPETLEQIALQKQEEFDSFVNGRFSEVYKTYRLKNRYSYRYNNIRLDMTVVRSSSSELNNKGMMVQTPQKNLIASNLINEDKQYEIELEIDYNYNKLPGVYTMKNISTRILDVIYMLKLHINLYPSIISKKEANIVLETYKSLIRNNHKEIIEKKIRILEYNAQQKKLQELETDKEREEFEKTETLLSIADIQEYAKKYKQLLTQTNSNTKKLKQKYYTMLENIKNKNYAYANNRTFFIGPKVVSMSIKDIQKNSSDSILKENYSITDKADGLGMLLYVYGYSHLTDDEIRSLVPFDDIRDSRDELDTLQGHMYLIDQNMHIYKTHISLIDENKEELSNSLFNGEYLDHGIINNTINIFKIYDGYIFNGKDIKHLPLKHPKPSTESRINYVTAFLSSEEDIDKRSILYKGEPIDDYTSDIVRISKKKFLYSYPKVSKSSKKTVNHLFKHSKELWETFTSSLSEYKYDGLIYTPSDTPVAFTNNSCDYDLYTHTTWSKNIKWKPPYENSIDFLVKEVKKETNVQDTIIYSPLIRTKRNTLDGNVVYTQYKTYHLYVGKNITDNNNACITKLRQKNRYLPIPFTPSILYDDMAYVANIEINLSDKEVHSKHWDHTTNQWKENKYDAIKDNTIVEFAYSNFDEEDGHYKVDKTYRWIPIRTRHDKTFLYKQGSIEKQKVYNTLKYLLQLRPNSYQNSSSSEFKRTIQQFLFTVKNAIIDVPDIQVYYKTRNYNTLLNSIISYKETIISYYSNYEHISRGININYGNNFDTANNVWFSIHNPITEFMISTGKNIPKMDVYELKYYNQKINVKRSKSISIHMQRFHNSIKLNMIKQVATSLRKDKTNKKLKLLDLATGKGGDIYKWINNKIHTVVGIDKVYDNIYNTFDGACVRRKNYKEKNNNKMPNIDFIVADVSNNLQDNTHFMDMFSKNIWFSTYVDTKFSIVTMMFALHYMFNDIDSVSTLVANINDRLQEGGYFIGCCFDGKKVFQLLQDIEINETKIGRKDGELIWKIQKKYNLHSWDQEDDSLFYDLPIDVYIRSINMNITEYLVNFDILIKECKKYNIKLVQSDLFDEIYEVQKTKDLSPDEQTLSFLNRRFIFKKITKQELVVDKITTLCIQILNNEFGKNTFKTKKNKTALKKELKKKEKKDKWNTTKNLIEEQIDEQNLSDEMPILSTELDSILDEVYKALQKKMDTF